MNPKKSWELHSISPHEFKQWTLRVYVSYFDVDGFKRSWNSALTSSRRQSFVVVQLSSVLSSWPTWYRCASYHLGGTYFPQYLLKTSKKGLLPSRCSAQPVTTNISSTGLLIKLWSRWHWPGIWGMERWHGWAITQEIGKGLAKTVGSDIGKGGEMARINQLCHRCFEFIRRVSWKHVNKGTHEKFQILVQLGETPGLWLRVGKVVVWLCGFAPASWPSQGFPSNYAMITHARTGLSLPLSNFCSKQKCTGFIRV